MSFERDSVPTHNCLELKLVAHLRKILSILSGKEKDQRVLSDWSNHLLSLVLLIVLITTFYLILRNVLFGNYTALIFNFTDLIIVSICIALAVNEKHTIAKVLLCSIFIISISIFSSMTSSTRGVSLFFFPAFGLCLILFSNKERLWQIIVLSACALAIISTRVLEVHPFGVHFVGQANESAYASNYFVALTLTIAIIAGMSLLVYRYHQALQLRSDELQRANSELLTSNRELDNFAHKLTHDLNAPLSSIEGIVNLFLMTSEGSVDINHLNIIKNKAAEMKKFIKANLEYARSKKGELRLEHVEIAALIREVVEDAHAMTQKNDLRFHLSLQANSIYSDKNCLRMILLNLICNAVIYQDKDDGIVGVEVSTVGNQYIIKVWDNGPGIADQHLSKIFEKFYRASSKPGSGLGLSIVKEAVNRLNGTAEVKSTVGVGTTFEIRLLANPGVNTTNWL